MMLSGDIQVPVWTGLVWTVLAVIGFWLVVWGMSVELRRLADWWRDHAEPDEPVASHGDAPACDQAAPDGTDHCWFDEGHRGAHSWEYRLPSERSAADLGFTGEQSAELEQFYEEDEDPARVHALFDAAEREERLDYTAEPVARSAVRYDQAAHDRQMLDAIMGLPPAQPSLEIRDWLARDDPAEDDGPEPERRSGTGKADRRDWHKRRGPYAPTQIVGALMCTSCGRDLDCEQHQIGCPGWDQPGGEWHAPEYERLEPAWRAEIASALAWWEGLPSGTGFTRRMAAAVRELAR